MVDIGSDVSLGAIRKIGELDARVRVEGKPGGNAIMKILPMVALGDAVDRGFPAPIVGGAE
jgi:hypothetical protein